MEEWEEMGFLEPQYLAAKVMTLFSMNMAPLLLAEHQMLTSGHTVSSGTGWSLTPKGNPSRAPVSYELVSFSQQVGAT